MSEGTKWRVLVIILFIIVLACVALANRYEYSKTPTGAIPIFERLDKWTGQVEVTNYVSTKWKAVQTQQLPAPPPGAVQPDATKSAPKQPTPATTKTS